MSKAFYTAFKMMGKNVFIRGYNEAGVRFNSKEAVDATLYTTRQTNSPSEYTTLKGEKLYSLTFDNPYDMRNHLKESFAQAHYGHGRLEYAHINSKFGTHLGCEFSLPKIKIAYLDIECESENGFPNIEQVPERINSICMRVDGRAYIVGLGNYLPHEDYITYHKAEDERDLFNKFVEWLKLLDPDVITGWNIEWFDIPYIVRRMAKVFGSEEAPKRLSPWGSLDERNYEMFGDKRVSYDIHGIQLLDYMDLYKRYPVPRQHESYALDYVCKKELGVGKDDWKAKWPTMKDFYRNDFQGWVQYNHTDTLRVEMLDHAKKFIHLVASVAYRAKVNYQDVNSQVKMWECLIHNHLLGTRKVLPPISQGVGRKDGLLEGAYVKLPTAGKYDWVMSFDATALYPSIIIGWNISPEMIIDEHNPATREEMMQGQFDHERLKQMKVCLAGNGHMFKNEEMGFLPEIVNMMFEERKIYKKKMLEAKNKLEIIKKEKERRGL